MSTRSLPDTYFSTYHRGQRSPDRLIGLKSEIGGSITGRLSSGNSVALRPKYVIRGSELPGEGSDHLGLKRLQTAPGHPDMRLNAARTILYHVSEGV